MIHRILVLVGVILVLIAPARAALDPELTKPYKLDVILHIADHRLLTPLFKEQTERELRDTLQGAYGDFAQVTLSRTHPRLKEIEEKGLQQTLDAWKDVTGVKTHFVLLDYVDGQYEIQARQHDGHTGKASPRVRKERTTDRQLVTRVASQLVGQDFGVLGTVDGKADGEQVKVALKASGLGVPADGLVKRGDVFLLFALLESAGKQFAAEEQWAVLRVEDEPKDGVCVCRVFRRYGLQDHGKALLGYRCLKIATSSAPLRLRVIKAGTGPRVLAEPNLQVHVLRRSFNPDDEKPLQGATDTDGCLFTDRRKAEPFENIAFVLLVGTDLKVKARIPVPIVDDRIIVIAVNLGAEANAKIAVHKDLWELRIFETTATQNTLFRNLKEMLSDPSQRQAVIDKAKSGQQALENDLANLRETLATLKTEKVVRLDLTLGEQRLNDLAKGQKELLAFIGKQEEVERIQRDPKWKELQDKAAQGLLLEGEAEFGKAIELYEQVKAGGLNDDKLNSHLDKLKKKWLTSDKELLVARSFVYEEWPKFDLAQMKERVAAAHRALAVCKRAKDGLTPQKLFKVTVAHVGSLKKHLEGSSGDDDPKRAQDLAELVEEMGKLYKDVSAYVEQMQER